LGSIDEPIKAAFFEDTSKSPYNVKLFSGKKPGCCYCSIGPSLIKAVWILAAVLTRQNNHGIAASLAEFAAGSEPSYHFPENFPHLYVADSGQES